MAEPEKKPFDFTRYLRTTPSLHVHLRRIDMSKVAPVPTPAVAEPSTARARVMHNLLMGHTLDGYELPWMRAVKNCMNIGREKRVPAYDPEQREHWDAMHHAMHELIRDVLMVEQGAVVEEGHMPIEQAIRAHWGLIFQQIEYFQNIYPDETLLTLPTRAEFMEALPLVREALLAAKTRPERTSREIEEEASARVRGKLLAPLVPDSVEAPSSAEQLRLPYLNKPPEVESPTPDGSSMADFLARYPSLSEGDKMLIAHEVESTIAQFTTNANKSWVQEIHGAIEKQRAGAKNQVPLVRLRQGFNSALWALANASVEHPVASQPSAAVSAALDHLMVLAAQVRTNCPDAKKDFDLPDQNLIQNLSQNAPALVEEGIRRGLRLLDEGKDLPAPPPSHVQRLEDERHETAVDEQPAVEDMERAVQLSILSTINPLNGGKWFDQVSNASMQHYEYLRERAEKNGQQTSPRLEAFDADIERFTESVRDYSGNLVEHYTVGNGALRLTEAYNAFAANYQKVLEHLPRSTRDTLPSSDMLLTMQSTMRVFAEEALKDAGARPAEGKKR